MLKLNSNIQSSIAPGEMAERFKAPVLKTGVGYTTEGSNPSLSLAHANYLLCRQVKNSILLVEGGNQ